MGKVLGIVYRAIETHLINKAGVTWAQASAPMFPRKLWQPATMPVIFPSRRRHMNQQ